MTTIQQQVVKAVKSALPRWKLEALTGLIGVRSMERMMDINHANLEAEGRWARRTLYGQQSNQETANPKGPDDDGDDMANTTVLGDITPTPVVVNNPPQNNVGSLLLTALMAAGIPTAGLAGYMLAKPQQQAIAPAVDKGYDDETVTIGLGRIEDLK